jgi:hypothetical protein
MLRDKVFSAGSFECETGKLQFADFELFEENLDSGLKSSSWE